MLQVRQNENLADYLTVGEAADYLGVSTWTLRNWDKAGKLKPLRHPKNGYRIYRHEELRAILEPDRGNRPATRDLSPRVDWSEMGEKEHFVQFYDNDDYLIESVCGFIGAGLCVGEAGIVIATRAHRMAIQRRLKTSGIPVTGARSEQRLVLLDAAETLSKFMVGEMPSAELFNKVVGGLIHKIAESGRPIRAFGEMVAILWSEGNREAAIRLEELWNELGKSHKFALFCAYPIRDCGGQQDEESFHGICASHSRVIPAESYASLPTADDRLREITMLQQKAESLAAEIAHRNEVEKALSRREQELIEQDRRKDEFLATLAHELRNPLAPIRNALEMMRLGVQEPEIMDEARTIMERQVQQMVRIVDDLLEVSRITRGRLELRKERLELSRIITNSVETSRPLIESFCHKFTATLPPFPVWLEGDLVRLGQVFANLLNNSAKYTPHGGQIWLTASLQGDEVVVSVRDTGIGIPPDALPHIFDMFQQVDQSHERSQGGLGIGLTLVRSLVELHGGSVNASSDGEGLGSEFVVRLPALREEANRSFEMTNDWRSPNPVKRRVLVIDDNVDAAKSLSVMLNIMGHEVRTAHDGRKGIETAEEFRPQLILMDVGMPDLNGYDATQRIRETAWGKDIAIVALSGWGQEEDVRRYQLAGCAAHLVKPIDPTILEQLLVTV